MRAWLVKDAEVLVAQTMGVERSKAAMEADAAGEAKELDRAGEELEFGSRISVLWTYRPVGAPMTVAHLHGLGEDEPRRVCKRRRLPEGKSGKKAPMRRALEAFASTTETWERRSWFQCSLAEFGATLDTPALAGFTHTSAQQGHA